MTAEPDGPPAGDARPGASAVLGVDDLAVRYPGRREPEPARA